MAAAVLTEMFHDGFPRLARSVLPPFLQVLEVAREAFGGDMDKVIIALAVGVRTAEHPDMARYSNAELRAIDVLPGLGISIRSIADSLGMPKETVRRKVRELIADGFMVRRQHNLFFTGDGYRRLGPSLEAFGRMVVRNYEVVTLVAAGAATPERLE